MGLANAPITLSELGVTDAPVTQSGLQMCLRFFDQHMSSLPRERRIEYLKAIDLHKPVGAPLLSPGKALIAFRKSRKPGFGEFFTNPGGAMQSLGVNPAGREFRRFTVRAPLTALESRCAPAADSWTDEAAPAYLASGGGTQYIIPNAESVLERTR